MASRIDSSGDSDWVRVGLLGGATYRVQQLGYGSGDGTLRNPRILGIYTAAGQAVPNTANDDFGGSTNAEVSFRAPADGSYYIAAAASGTGTGTYRLAVSAAVADTLAPTLQAFSPADGAVGVAVGSNLTFGFSEPVQGGSGNIVVAGGGETLTIPVGSAQVSISGGQLTVNPSADLKPGVSYSVTMAEGAVLDLAGNPFAGILGPARLGFTTAAAPSPDADTWTVMVYLAADNDLESFAARDLNEMESAILPANVNLVALVDRTPGYDSGNGNWTNTRRGTVVHDTRTGTVSSFAGFETLGELNTGAAATLTDFIDWAAETSPADHYALVIWDHGGGLSGTCWDETSNGDNLTANELRNAIARSTVDRFDLVGFDACLQGMVEQAWDLADLAEVLVVSEELIPGTGWAYDRWLGELAADPQMTAEDLGRSIVTGYGQEYAGQSDITLSAVRTSALPGLDSALDGFVADALAAGTAAADWQAMRTAAARSVNFDYDYRDLGSFMGEVESRVGNAGLRADAAAVSAAVADAVFARSGTVAGATGLSIYLPYGPTQVEAGYTAANHSFLGASQWEGFLAVV
jgi:hypothetical protein